MLSFVKMPLALASAACLSAPVLAQPGGDAPAPRLTVTGGVTRDIVDGAVVATIGASF